MLKINALAATIVLSITSSIQGQAIYSQPGKVILPKHQDNTYSVALGDVDADGDLDLACGNMGAPNGQNKLYLNNGRGGFVDVTASHFPLAGDSTMALALGDVDGDGDLDLVCANYAYPTGQNSLWLNDGKGKFTDATTSRMPSRGDLTYSLAMGDLDGDGDLDLIFGNAGRQNRLYLNDGKGFFTDHTAVNLPVDVDVTSDLALGDVDGDGDLDLVCGNSQQNRLYLNNGKGRLSYGPGKLPLLARWTTSLALGDIDGDGDLDLFCGNAGGIYGNTNQLYQNDGKGNFSDVTVMRTPLMSDLTWSVAMGDVDGDGDQDLICGNNTQNNLLLNNGKGFFSDITKTLLPKDDDLTYALALGDLDGDDDLDLVYGNTNVPFIPQKKLNRILLNLTRQVDGPNPPRLGGDYQLDLYARSPQGNLLQLVVPFLSSQTKQTLVPPFGVFGLDFNKLIMLGVVFVAPTNGRARLSFHVPGNPTLINQNVYIQGLHITDLNFQHAAWRFTNMIKETVK